MYIYIEILVTMKNDSIGMKKIDLLALDMYNTIKVARYSCRLSSGLLSLLLMNVLKN